MVVDTQVFFFFLFYCRSIYDIIHNKVYRESESKDIVSEYEVQEFSQARKMGWYLEGHMGR